MMDYGPIVAQQQPLFFQEIRDTVAIPAINASGLALTTQGYSDVVSVWNNLGNGYSYKSDNISVANMNEFFETEFGSELKNNATKTKKSYQSQAIYKVDKDIPEYGLKKGDQFYLDAKHKDHLEVFDSNGNLRTVLNLDGTVNLDKYRKAIRRTLK